MNRSNLVIVFIFSTIWYACSDDEPSIHIDLDKKYSFNRVEASPVRIFTMYGEIKDDHFRQHALARFNEINTFSFDFLSGNEGIEVSKTEYIEFDHNFATINSSDQYSYSVSGDFLRLTELDTSFFTYEPSSVDTSMESIGLHHWSYKEVDVVPGTTGIMERIKYLDEKYAKIRPGQILFPVLRAFYFSHHNRPNSLDGGIKRTALILNNEFNEKIYQEMSEMDTLIVQEAWIIFD